jgi:hypothetical protein
VCFSSQLVGEIQSEQHTHQYFCLVGVEFRMSRNGPATHGALIMVRYESTSRAQTDKQMLSKAVIKKRSRTATGSLLLFVLRTFARRIHPVQRLSDGDRSVFRDQAQRHCLCEPARLIIG